MTERKAQAKKQTPRQRRVSKPKGEPYINLRDDGRYIVSIELGNHPNGKRNRPQKTFGTKEEAEAYKANADVQRLQKLPQDLREMTVSQLLNRHVAGLTKGEYSTALYRDWIKTVIVHRIGSLKVAELRPSRIREFLNELRPEVEGMDEGEQTSHTEHSGGNDAEAQQNSKKQYAKSTCDKALLMLRAALREAVDDGLLVKNPAEKVKPIKVQLGPSPQAWSEKEIQNIVNASRNSDIFMVVLIGLATGARIGEIVGLRMTDYDPNMRELSLHGTVKRQGGRGKGKTGMSHRVVVLAEPIHLELAKHLDQVARLKDRAGPKWGQRKKFSEKTRLLQREAARKRWNSGLPPDWIPPAPPSRNYVPLFPTSRGTPMCTNNVRRAWEKILKACEMKHRNFHQTRSTFITNALCTPEVTIKDVQDVVGHASPTTTLRYLQSSPERQKKVMAGVLPMLGLTDENPPPSVAT